ncbi:MBL fold metallo-hydrolase [Alkalibacterium sp. 20]|uniref:MBL fold metallo-hydrolase n=1 Tax=Alkalibacterium sp. 20 TaxID=1798803 RepID=UPI0008FFF0FA|nr:MBL fold metallo-hydrolase [Alkalibacterium sp. 20]OJF92118.1 hydrolase glyoxylase [Alkalibacterium sp. 20]
MLHYQKNNLTVFQSSLYKTTSAVIHSEEAIIMTDPTWLPEEIEGIKRYIKVHLGDKQLYIIYTHSDFDHIIGSGAFPEATVIASEEFQNNPKKEEVLKDIDAFDQEYYLERNYVPQYPTVDRVIKKDGEKMELGDMTLNFYKAPGHTNDGLFTVIEPCGIFLSGDYLSDIEFPFITSGYHDYIDTIDKASLIMQYHDINIHVPGHGNATNQKQEIMDRIDFSKQYLKRLLNNDTELEKECRSKFRFFEGMKSSHLENVERANKK